ncbi:hypothetical protein GCM10011514_13290 [Emticicia aquatilis]|uniref:Uncharacterized protein n=1 Tax=Emticicia aquatilis TaxID=1537369 RepID=A0A916YLL4_9BACT|nr:hypothetical protein [Emticicia aquatilis]GGD50380.1 hypothetical protein GCM10011514_13290 [Emticicia aquatilis]
MKNFQIIAAILLVFSLLFISNHSNSAIPKTNKTLVDDGINELGILRGVEDSGYPLATLHIEFPERKFSEYFTINLEEVKNVNMGILQKWKGKYVAFTYNSDFTNSLIDLQINGKSAINTEPMQFSDNVQIVVGVLRGAGKVTESDLPSTISITTTDNQKLLFDYYVTPEMVKINGRKVMAYYEEVVSNTITKIKVSK